MTSTTPNIEKHLHEMLRDAPMMNDSNSAVHSGFTNLQVQNSSKNCSQYCNYLLVQLIKRKILC